MNSQTSRNISTVVGALNIVPSFMLSRKLVQSAGWKGSMLPGPNIAVMRQNKALSAVYLGLMAVQVGFAVKALVDQYKEDSAEVPTLSNEDVLALLNLSEGTYRDEDGISRCEIDHVEGGPCLTPLSEDGTCPNEADHDMPARV